jgi:hypothetical protein
MYIYIYIYVYIYTLSLSPFLLPLPLLFLLILLLLLLLFLLLLLPGAELPLVESFGLLNDLFLLPSILDAGYPVLDHHLANVPLDVILPSVLGSSLCSFS